MNRLPSTLCRLNTPFLRLYSCNNPLFSLSSRSKSSGIVDSELKDGPKEGFDTKKLEKESMEVTFTWRFDNNKLEHWDLVVKNNHLKHSLLEPKVGELLDLVVKAAKYKIDLTNLEPKEERSEKENQVENMLKSLNDMANNDLASQTVNQEPKLDVVEGKTPQECSKSTSQNGAKTDKPKEVSIWEQLKLYDDQIDDITNVLVTLRSEHDSSVKAALQPLNYAAKPYVSEDAWKAYESEMRKLQEKVESDVGELTRAIEMQNSKRVDLIEEVIAKLEERIEVNMNDTRNYEKLIWDSISSESWEDLQKEIVDLLIVKNAYMKDLEFFKSNGHD